MSTEGVERLRSKDRYQLKDMKVGDEIFVIGIMPNEISPYTSYLKKTGRGEWATTKGSKDGVEGTIVTRTNGEKQ